jgi:hypothetical protein
MTEVCLAATGQEQWPFIALALVAVALLTVGAVLIARKRGRAVLFVAPLAVLALVAGGTVAQPAQAVTAKISDTVMSTEWNYDWPDITSDVPSASNFALFEQAAMLQQAAGTVPTYRTFITWPGSEEFPGAETFEVVPNIAGLDASNGVGEINGDDVEDAIIEWWSPLALQRSVYTLTMTVTFDYLDDCGKPLQTVFTYTGTYNNQLAG